MCEFSVSDLGTTELTVDSAKLILYVRSNIGLDLFRHGKVVILQLVAVGLHRGVGRELGDVAALVLPMLPFRSIKLGALGEQLVHALQKLLVAAFALFVFWYSASARLMLM